MNVEGDVKAVFEEVEVKAETVAAEVKKEVETVVEKVEQAVINLVAEERLFLREAEFEYLKATMEIQRLSKITENKSKEYQTYIDGLVTKHGIDKAKYVFDGTINAFKKL